MSDQGHVYQTRMIEIHGKWEDTIAFKYDIL